MRDTSYETFEVGKNITKAVLHMRSQEEQQKQLNTLLFSTLESSTKREAKKEKLKSMSGQMAKLSLMAAEQ